MMARMNVNRFYLPLWNRVSRWVCKNKLFCLIAWQTAIFPCP